MYAHRKAGEALVIRGVPGITEADWRRGSGVIERGVQSFGTAVKSAHGLFSKRTRRWSLPNHERQIYGDRKMGSDGITVPMAAKELRELTIARRKKAERAKP